MTLGDVTPGELRELVPLDGTFVPRASNRAVYDELYDEFPRLYRSQRGLSRRLNGRVSAAPAGTR